LAIVLGIVIDKLHLLATPRETSSLTLAEYVASLMRERDGVGV